MNYDKEVFYEKQREFWSSVPPTVDGVLEGNSQVHDADIEASAAFIEQFFQDEKKPLGKVRALDVGSGIGRVTKHLLKLFRSVDMVDQNVIFLLASFDYIGDESGRVPIRHNSDLQSFRPTNDMNNYDLIWMQWILGYLLDLEVRSCLVKLKNSLSENGVIIVKDNLPPPGQFQIRHNDGSVIRSRDQIVDFFSDIGMSLVAEAKQPNFPPILCEVTMLAFRC